MRTTDGEAPRPVVPVFHGATGIRPDIEATCTAALHELLDDEAVSPSGLSRLRPDGDLLPEGG